MKKAALIVLTLFSVLLTQCGTTSQFENYVTANKDKLMEGEKELRFVSFNIPNLNLIEDYESGGKVTRMYVLSVRRNGESKNIVRYIEGPGKFNKKAFRTLDKILQIANEEGVRLIIPFVDNWWWWGGPAEYAAFRNKKAEEFWTDPQLISDFEKTISFVLNRKNTYTGVLYKDDKSVLGWETGNELEASLSWQDTIASYIKSLDKNHLVLFGTHAQVLSEEAVADTNFDVLSTHYYSPIQDATKNILLNRELTKGKKPYFVGEFGYHNVKDVKTIVDTAVSSGLAGIMIWSLRFHSRDGGFYQHGEGYSTGSYRFPGFKSGDIYHEKEIINIIRKNAYRINNEKESPLPVPDPPALLAVKDVYDISWQGSAGAESYTMQRKEAGSDEWETIASSVSDADVVFRPLFADTAAKLGHSYYYRVRAVNQSGSSAPSNVIGPVEVNYKKFVDELNDPTGIFQSSDSSGLKFLRYQDVYKAKDDNSRLKGEKDSYIIYQMPKAIDSIKVEVFLTDSQCGLDFFAADSLSNLKPLAAKVETFPPYKNFYGFFTPALYTCDEFPPDSRYLKIKFNDTAQLGRVEIIYSKIEKPDSNIITVP